MKPRQQPSTHPSWCDPRVCEPTPYPDEPMHAGTPVEYWIRETETARVTAHLQQASTTPGCDPEPIYCRLVLERFDDEPGQRLVAAADVEINANELRIVAALLDGMAAKLEDAR